MERASHLRDCNPACRELRLGSYFLTLEQHVTYGKE